MALPIVLGVAVGAASLFQGFAGFQAGRRAARIGEQDAEAARLATEDAIRRAREEAERTVSSVRARAAGAGLDPSFGSPIEVIAQTYRNLEADVTAIARSGGAEVRRSLSEAAAARAAGRAALIGGIIRAGTSIVSSTLLARQPLGQAGRFGRFGDDFPGTVLGMGPR